MEKLAESVKSGKIIKSSNTDIKSCSDENETLIKTIDSHKLNKPNFLNEIEKNIGINKLLIIEWKIENFGMNILNEEEKNIINKFNKSKFDIKENIGDIMNKYNNCRANEILQSFKQCKTIISESNNDMQMCYTYLESKRLEAKQNNNQLLSDALEGKNVVKFLELTDEQQKTLVNAIAFYENKTKFKQIFGKFSGEWIAQQSWQLLKCSTKFIAPFDCYIDLITNSINPVYETIDDL